MKKFISKVKKSYKDFMTGKSGFSLVELIVVIAIMAVMAAVLAPALLGYVERSRAQKDDSAMDEVVNSVQLSLADQDVYDEMLVYAAEQYSCYVDSTTPSESHKVELKAGKYFTYSSEARQLDETVYKLDGVMRGVTITFAPDAAASNKATLDLIKGQVNKYLPASTKTYGGLTGANASPMLSDIADSELYNSLRATIGDKIVINSQTYRNSEYTIFISMGTTGGQEAAAQDAIKVWGQFSGTNLPEGSSVAKNPNSATNPNGTSAGSNNFQGTQTAPVAGVTFGLRLKVVGCHNSIHDHNSDCYEACNDFVAWADLSQPTNYQKYGYGGYGVSDTDINPGALYMPSGKILSATIPVSVTYIGDVPFLYVEDGYITYLGTTEQWNAITIEGWDSAMWGSKVKCTDGEITL